MPDPGLVGPLGLFCGYLALVIWLVWDVGHACHDPHCMKGKEGK